MARTPPAVPSTAGSRHRTHAVALVGVADRRRAQIEASVRDDAHRIEELAAEKLQADDALDRGRAAGIPAAGTGCRAARSPGRALKIASTCLERLDHLDARAASALVGLEQRRPLNVADVGTQRADVVERQRPRTIDAERAQQRRLRALAQLEREHVRAVQDPGARAARAIACRRARAAPPGCCRADTRSDSPD